MSVRTRRSLALSWSALFVLSLLLQYFTFALAPAALAVHNTGLFELDGNATNDAAVAGDDWNSHPGATGNRFTFINDLYNSSNDVGFSGGGSKDDLNTSSWAWEKATVTPDKDDIEHAYAASYVQNGHTFVYFGLDKLAVNGDSNVGFWFFKNGINLTGSSTSGGFAPQHSVGDLLVLSQFTNGGVVSVIDLYEWVGSGGSDGTLDKIASGNPCTGSPAVDKACAIANTGPVPAPWSYHPKSGADDIFPAASFFEGGIDLDALFGGHAPCFSGFLANTRTSQEVNAVLKDVAVGGFNTCVPPTTVTAPSSTTADFGGSVTDTATLSGSDGAASGDVDFWVCGPAASKPACTTGGTHVGSVPVTTTANGGHATSAAFPVGVTAAASGYYCWRTVYIPDANSQYLTDTHTDVDTECFYVAPATIHIDKTANPVGPVSAGDTIGFDITVTNGNATQTTLGVSVSDTLPAGVAWTADAPTGSTTDLSCNIAAGPPQVLTCTKPSLAHGASFSVHIHGTTDAADCGTVSNTANVATSNDGSGSNGASVVVQCPNVTVAKTPDAGSVTAGGDAIFTIVVSNSNAAGTGTARGVTLTDNLPAGYTWAVGGADQAACSIDTTAPSPDVLSCDFGDMAPGASRTITLTAATSGANCAVIPNTAVVDATNEPNTTQYTSNNSDNGSINVLCAQIGIVKNANPVGPVSAGDDIGFDVIVTNSGDGAANNVNVTDNLPTGITWTADAPTGTASASCSIDTTAPSPDVLSCSAATMAAGSSFTVHIHGTTDAADCGTVSNLASVTSGNDGSGEDGASVVVQCPDLQVVKTGNGPLSAGDPATFSIVLTNLGPGAAKNVTLSDQLPSGTWTVGVVGANATACSVDVSNLLTCHFGGVAAPPTGNTRTVTLTKTTVAAECPSIHNDVTVAATNEPSTALANNSSSADIVVNCPDVHVLKTADNGTISAGQTAAFTIVVSNDGLGTARTVTLHDVLPSGVAWAINPAVTGCAIASNVLDCSFSSLAPAASVTIHVSGLTDKLDCAGLDNTAVVAAVNEPVADQADNSSHAFITVQCPDLGVTKAADNGTISAGDVAAFTIVVTNHGPGVALDVHVADTLPAGVNWAIDPAVTGCSIAANHIALTCDFASLASGASVTIHVSGETTALNCGTLHNEVSVSATNENTDTDEFSNSASADITVNCPAIVLTKSADAVTISAGDPIGFTITVANTGAGNATSVHVTDDLPAGITWTADPTTGTASATCSIDTAPSPDVLTCNAAVMASGSNFSVHIHGATTAANCGAVNNSASVTTGNDGGDDDSSSVTVLCPDVTVVKSPDGGNVNAGDDATFTIVVSNASAEGTGTAHNVTLTDSLPAGYTWSLGGANAASCSINTVPNPDVLSCNFGDLAAGASRTITLTTPTTGANCAAIPNLATVAASNEAPQQQGNNSDTGSINVRCANIAIAKVANPAGPISAGGTVGFDITVHNTGDGIATGVTVTDNLPAGIDWTLGAVTGDTTGVACAISGAVGSEKLACTDPSLGADGSFAVHVSGPSDAADCGTVSNTASVATTNDGSASATASVAVVCSALQIQKSFTGNTAGTDPDLDVPAANIGDTLHYSLAYTGSGPLHNSVITDTLPRGLAYVDGSAAGNADFNPGVYDSTTRTITWHAKGVLPDPASGTVTYDITVLDTAPDFAQPLVNLATIDSDETPVDQATASVAVLAPPLELTPPPVHVTPPPTSTLTPESAPSNPGFALMLMLFGIAGLALGIGFVTPTPERVRRRNRLG